MTYQRIVISSGHGRYIRGAAGIIDEVEEARKVTEQLAAVLADRGVEVITFHDNTSTSQDENLWNITDFHNEQERDLDISVHFNAFEQRNDPVGTEVWYVTEYDLAKQLSAAMASVGLIDRGAKYTDCLHFLNQTDKPAVLLEVCFVDSKADTDIYYNQFGAICEALAAELAGDVDVAADKFRVEGRVSHFGGPDDMGVSSSEDLAFIYSTEDKPVLFLSYQPIDPVTGEVTTGLARRLNPDQPYVACRWPYTSETKAKWREVLLKEMALVYAPKTGKAVKCYCADWGPHEEDTGRAADVSPSTLERLGIQTDDEVIVSFPFTNRRRRGQT